MNEKKEYKTLELRSIKDFKKAERLQAKGWRVILSGIYSILLER